MTVLSADKDVLRHDRGALLGALVEIGVDVSKPNSIRCPFHDDRNPSAGIYPESDGHWAFKCHGCDFQGDVFDVRAKASGQKLRDVLPKKQRKEGFDSFDTVAEWVRRKLQAEKRESVVIAGSWCYPNGLHVVRYEWGHSENGRANKTCRQFSRNGVGWVCNASGARGPRPPLYLAEIKTAPLVLLTEGEQKVDLLRRLGFAATTFGSCEMGGAENSDISALSGVDRTIAILPDADEAGERFAVDLSARLLRLLDTPCVKVVRLPALPPKGDIIDYRTQRPDEDDAAIADQIRHLIDQTPRLTHAETCTTKPKPSESGAIELNEKYRCDDIGNGQRMVAQHGRNIRYLAARKSWLIFDGQRWAVDDMNQNESLAKATARSIYIEASKADESHVQKLAQHAKESAARARIEAMIKMARSEPGIAVKPDVLDTDPMFFNLSNGTLDLRTGKLRPHNRADMITKLGGARFDPAAKCPEFFNFLDRIMRGNTNLIRFLQRVVGYSLTGLTGERCMFILYGNGANGKTVFIETIAALLGDYALAVPASTILACRNDERPRNDLAQLAGVRLATAVETNEGRRLDEAIVKIVTGGDRIAARFLFQEHFTYLPAFKLFMATNHRPEIRGIDDAIWARIRLVPFDVVIPESERDHGLKDKLRQELSGIQNWGLEGWLECHKTGLNAPQEVLQATSSYRNEQDHVGEFIEECCKTAEGLLANTTALYERYEQWCASSGVEALNLTAFGRRLSDRKFEVTRCPATGRKMRRGIALLTEEAPL